MRWYVLRNGWLIGAVALLWGCAEGGNALPGTDALVAAGGTDGAGGRDGGGGSGGRGGGGGSGCPDVDRDGYQDQSCNPNRQTGGDCDDVNNLVNPGREDVCADRIDNNCDGQVNEGCSGDCPDADQDGHRDGRCDANRNTGADCDDQNNTVHPGANEICGNFRDDDCQGGDVPCLENCTDNDQDGFGTGSGCRGPDCDDANAAVNPWANERCGDNIDQDCSGGDLACPQNCTDRDKDGFGQGEGCLDADCNDQDADINPGAREVPGDTIDQDCSGADLTLRENCTDRDQDSYGEGAGCAGQDCDDTDPRANPGRAEVCGNGRDDDCQNGDRTCVGMGTGECIDNDGDGFGEGGCLRGNVDCDDNDQTVHPDAQEACNGRDDNCNHEVDECPRRNSVCDGAACVGRAGAPCRADGECAQALGLSCSGEAGECRVADGEACVENSDCMPGGECILLEVCDGDVRRCYQAKGGPCQEDCDCTGDWLCHPENNRCIECQGDFGCGEDARDTCTEGGYCVEAQVLGGAGEDVRIQFLQRLASCWSHFAESNEAHGCDHILFDDTFEVAGQAVNHIGDVEEWHDDGFACDRDLLGDAGFSDDDIDALRELFGHCGVVDVNVINLWWVAPINPGSEWCLYYVPQKSGFGFPSDERAAVVVDRCNVSAWD